MRAYLRYIEPEGRKPSPPSQNPRSIHFSCFSADMLRKAFFLKNHTLYLELDLVALMSNPKRRSLSRLGRESFGGFISDTIGAAVVLLIIAVRFGYLPFYVLLITAVVLSIKLVGALRSFCRSLLKNGTSGATVIYSQPFTRKARL